LSACALAQSTSGGGGFHATAKSVSFTLQSLEPVAIQAMQLAANCLQPFAASPASAPSSSSSSSPHEMTLLLAHASLHFSSQFFSAYAATVRPAVPFLFLPLQLQIFLV
jgi:hypothetical protein